MPRKMFAPGKMCVQENDPKNNGARNATQAGERRAWLMKPENGGWSKAEAEKFIMDEFPENFEPAPCPGDTNPGYYHDFNQERCEEETTREEASDIERKTDGKIEAKLWEQGVGGGGSRQTKDDTSSKTRCKTIKIKRYCKYCEAYQVI